MITDHPPHERLIEERTMLGLTPLGTIHTAISVVALLAGFGSLVRYGRIAAENRAGQAYVWATVLTCITGFGIFQRGGFGAPHALGIVTLLVIAFTYWPAGASIFGARWRYVTTVSFSLTLFFHMIPGVTETFTRLPTGAPLFSGPEDPSLQRVAFVMFLVFVCGAAWQVLHLRAGTRGQTAAGTLRSASNGMP
jgi:hypothetical protein